MSQELNMLALVKGEEKYVFLFDDNNRSETLRQLGKYASDPDLSFTWYDAAVLSQKIRATTETAEANRAEASANCSGVFATATSKAIPTNPVTCASNIASSRIALT